MKQTLTQNIKLIVLCLIIASGVSYVYADWAAPLSSPPTCVAGNPGCDAPLNVGATAQTKNGPLTINSSTTISNSLSVNTSVTPATYGLNVWGISKFWGGVQIPVGSPTVGQVLTAADTSGTVSWQTQNAGAVPSKIVVFDASGSWTAPAGVTRARVRVWGGGGAGCVDSNGNGFVGGGGGYAESIVTVSPGTAYTITVGAGGLGMSSIDPIHPGGNSSFSTLVKANGGGGSTCGGVISGGAGTLGDITMSGASNGDSPNSTVANVPGGGGTAVYLQNVGNGAHGRVVIEY